MRLNNGSKLNFEVALTVVRNKYKNNISWFY